MNIVWCWAPGLDKVSSMLAYALAIFSGAFLLFQVQPILGKYILPWFGGGPGVWTACLLFFQLALLGGYVYAHLLTSKLTVRRQVVVHAVMMLLALLFLPVTPSERWKPLGPESPTWRIMSLLTCTVGVPYLLLAATGPLLQRWLTLTHRGAQPYRLYALSNIASLGALLTFPFLVEPEFTRRQQVLGWSAGFAVYAALMALAARSLWRTRSGPNPGSPDQAAAARGSPPGLSQKAFWFLLPFCGSVMLLATTNKICQDVAVVPFLWVLPLAVYLLSFVIAFDSPRWYHRVPFTFLLIAALAGVTWALFHGTEANIKINASVYVVALFICCTVCHAEAHRLRPGGQYLTRFYLAISLGGAAGGAFVALAAPVLFESYYEVHISVFLCGLLFLLLCSRNWGAVDANPDAPAKEGQPFVMVESQRAWQWLACTLPLAAFAGLDQLLAYLGHSGGIASRQLVVSLRVATWCLLALLVLSWLLRGMHKRFVHWRLLTCLWLMLGLAALGPILWQHAASRDPDIVYRHRNFYGTLTVYEHMKDDPLSHYRLLQHGGITHGIQLVDYDQSNWPTTYYGQGSGLAKAISALPVHARRIGAVGLGTGTVAAHAKPGDYIRFYEINPEIKKVASDRFTYLSRCKGLAEVVLGDARVSMEADLPQEFDLLILDAFNGDAIPTHLLTREAFVLYDRHLKEKGIIAVHISNHYLDLEPVVNNVAREFRFATARVEYEQGDEWWQYSSLWLLLCRDEHVLEVPAIQEASSVFQPASRNVRLWTDDFTSIYGILK